MKKGGHMYGGPERRKHKRIKKRYIMRFNIKKHDAAEEWDMVALVDIGAGGALFYYNSNIEKDALLDLKINFDQDKDPITCTGKVLRCEELEYSYMYLIAVTFEDISQEEKDLINKAAEEFHNRRPRYLED